jgi:predicted alpha-1,2-mannosidase
MGQVGGALPRWSLAHGDARSMVGSPADMVMSESAAKGVAFDEDAAYALARAAAYAPAPGGMGGRDGVEDYVALGWVPSDRHGGSVANTLEQCIADAALAGWAARLGHDDDAAEFAARAGNWANLHEPTTGFLRPRKSDGAWDAWSDAEAMDDAYTEGNAWQYLFMVPHDLDALAEALGGRDAALAKARMLFELSEQEVVTPGPQIYHWHGNEPDIIAPWVFAAWGEPHETRRWVDWVVRQRYGPGPDGLPGNDDGGTMSAWILFAASGMYPIAGTDRYILGYPRQPLMVLRRGGGDLRIEAAWPPPESYAVTLDGEPVAGPELTHDRLVGAHTLRFE